MKLHIIEKTIDINQIFLVYEEYDNYRRVVAAYDDEKLAKQHIKKGNVVLTKEAKKKYGKHWKLYCTRYTFCYEKFDVLSRLEE